MQLTQRAENIIKILARFPQDNPVTIGIISEELGISNRSIQRELPTVKNGWERRDTVLCANEVWD